MKIFLLIAEILFTVFMIWRRAKKARGDRNAAWHYFFRKNFIRLAIVICFCNFYLISGDIDGLGYIPDMIFLGIVIAELLFGNL